MGQFNPPIDDLVKATGQAALSRFQKSPPMKTTLLMLLMVTAACADGPPKTRTCEQVDHYHGTQVADPYRWLEEAASPEVKAWLEAQNKYAEQVLAGFPEGPALTQRVNALALTSQRKSSPQLVGHRLFFMRDTPPQPQPVVVAQNWPDGLEKVLVDPNQAGGSEAVVDFWPSQSGRYLAFGTALGGSESVTLQVVDTLTGKRLADKLPRAGGGTTPAALLWDADEHGFTYVRLPPTGPDFGAVLAHHRLGQPASTDGVEFGAGLSPVAEYSLSSSCDGQAAAAVVHFGDGSPGRVYLRIKNHWKLALGPEANVRSEGRWWGNRLLLVSHANAPKGRLLAVSTEGRVQTLLPEDAWATNEVFPIQGGLLVSRVCGPDWRLDHYDGKGRLLRHVGLPATGISLSGVASSEQSDDALISFEGWTTPTRWDRYQGANGALHNVFAVKPAADYSAVKVYQQMALSKDGTHVPVTVLTMESSPKDGQRPTILTGYGGFDVNTAPRFIGPQLAWLERGGVYAVANLRGGGEFGEEWHQQGMLGHKQNVFDDFYAASQVLIEQGWTCPARLAITGGSNGGLLMGASISQHPEQFRAVVGFVGLYDMLRSQLWPNGTYNIPEFGTVTEAAGFHWLYQYSPLHNLKVGSAYPSVLLETGENDPRVAPWQSRKFAAALQAANTSANPILLITQSNAGHGMGASFSQRVGKSALLLTFCAHELGGLDPAKP